MSRRKVVFIILFVLITWFIFANSAKDAVESTAQSDSLVGWVIDNMAFLFKDRGVATHYVRKFAHFAEFFAQGLAVSGALFSVKYYKSFIYVLLTGFCTACIDEHIQLFFEGRSAQISDVFVDFSGTILSVICFMILWLVVFKKAGK